MQYRALGRTGLEVSEVGFGGAQAGIANYVEPWDVRGAAEQHSVQDALERAIDLGLNYVDTAPAYGDGLSETVLGPVVARHRSSLVVATKVTHREPAAIAASVEGSLRRLRTDVIDVLQFHGGWYPDEDVRAILDRGGAEALARLRDDGKVRFTGFTAEGPSGGVSRLIASGLFDVMQVRYNLMYQHTCDHVNREGVMREADARGMGILTMRTLTSGTFQRLAALALPELAGVDLDALLLSYVLSNPLVDVALVGMRRAREAERCAAVSDDVARRIDLEALHDRFVMRSRGRPTEN
jgi:aryl-alcohol dehydrogenase-like predicted oxidoreductase